MSIKFVHTGDGHIDSDAHGSINPKTGINKAWESHARVLRNAVQEALDQQVDFFLHAGDGFKTGRPSQEAVLLFADVFKPLVEAGVPLVLLGGNHELLQVPVSQRTATETVGDLLKPLGEVHVVERDPQLVQLSSGAQVAALPWLSKARILQKLGEDGLDPLEGDRKVAQFALDSLDRISHGVDTSAPYILASHVTVDDVRIDSLAEGARRGSEVDIAQVFAEPIVPRSGIEESPVSYGALAHIHARQRMGEKCFYAGSPDRLTMTDADDPKSVNFVTISDDNKLEKVEHFDTDARPMHSISLTDDDAEDRLEELAEGALVRLELPPGESVAPESIRKLVADAGAQIVATKVTPKERKKNTAAILPEKVGPEEALRSWFKKVSPDGVDQDYALKLTTQMMED